MSDTEVKLARLITAINAAWISCYGGEEITDIAALACRVTNIAADRDCWVFNAKVNQKEYLRLDAMMRDASVA
jgi:hypothetical protein